MILLLSAELPIPVAPLLPDNGRPGAVRQRRNLFRPPLHDQGQPAAPDRRPGARQRCHLRSPDRIPGVPWGKGGTFSDWPIRGSTAPLRLGRRHDPVQRGSASVMVVGGSGVF